MNEVFFRASQDALDNITNVFDFVHPLTASMKFTGDKVVDLTLSMPVVFSMSSLFSMIKSSF